MFWLKAAADQVIKKELWEEQGFQEKEAETKEK